MAVAVLYYFKWASLGFLFSSFNTLKRKQMFKFLLMTVFEPWTFGIGSDHSTKWATTTARQIILLQSQKEYCVKQFLLAFLCVVCWLSADDVTTSRLRLQAKKRRRRRRRRRWRRRSGSISQLFVDSSPDFFRYLTNRMSLGVSATRLVCFWKVLTRNFLTKVAQNLSLFKLKQSWLLFGQLL